MSVNLSQWTGLLKWSMQYQDGTSPTTATAMSDERREFLTKAMEENVVDPAQQLKALIAILDTPQNAGEEDAKLTAEYVTRKAEVLRVLIEFVEIIDWANDFVTMGGFKTTVGLLSSPHAEVRVAALEVVAIVMQNNPRGQAAAMELDVLPVLVASLRRPLADSGAEHAEGVADAPTEAMKAPTEGAACVADSAEPALSKTERTKTLLALAGLVRDCTAATVAFIKDHKGVGLLMDVVRAPEEVQGVRTRRKALFLVRYLISTLPAIKAALADTLAGTLNESMASEDIDLRENSLHLLAQLYTDKNSAARVAADTRLATTASIAKLNKALPAGDESADEARRLADLVTKAIVNGPTPPSAADQDAAPMLLTN